MILYLMKALLRMVAGRCILNRLTMVIVLVICLVLVLVNINLLSFYKEDKIEIKPINRKVKSQIVEEKESVMAFDDLSDNQEYKTDKVQFWDKHLRIKPSEDEERKFVFIKCMKCATSTVASILRRFAYTRHLNVVLPRGSNIYLGWPYIMEKQDYRSSNQSFDCLIEHAIYNNTVMRTLFPANVSYITIIREPWSHFKSTFKYFNVKNIAKVEGPESQSVSAFLRNCKNYDTFYKSHEASEHRYCIPDGFSVTKNLLSHCLGMPLGFPTGRPDISHNEELVNDYIEKLDQEFALVMIMEYFHESLIMLKRLMKWTFRDIVYISSNIGSYKYSKNKLDKPRYKRWSPIDHQLYDHFNKSFWEKVAHESTDFRFEVKKFSSISKDINEFCNEVTMPGKILESVQKLVFPPSHFDPGFSFSAYDCKYLREPLLEMMQTRHNREFPSLDTQYKRSC